MSNESKIKRLTDGSLDLTLFEKFDSLIAILRERAPDQGYLVEEVGHGMAVFFFGEIILNDDKINIRFHLNTSANIVAKVAFAVTDFTEHVVFSNFPVDHRKEKEVEGNYVFQRRQFVEFGKAVCILDFCEECGRAGCRLCAHYIKRLSKV